MQRLGENVGNRIGELIASQGEKLDGVTGQISALTEGNERRQETLRTNVEAKLVELKTDALVSAKALREEVTGNLQNLGVGLTQNVEQDLPGLGDLASWRASHEIWRRSLSVFGGLGGFGTWQTHERRGRVAWPARAPQMEKDALS